MSSKARNMTSAWLVVTMAALLLALTACTSEPGLRWTEDVVLPDARVVTLKREQWFDRGYVSAHSFEFQHPSSGELVRWNTDGFFALVALFLVQDVPHILVKPTFGKQNEQAGCPEPSMFIYRYERAGWIQIPYAQSPVRFIARNVTSDPKAKRKLIERHAFKIPAGSIDAGYAPIDAPRFSIDLAKISTQTFKCPAQKRIQFQ